MRQNEARTANRRLAKKRVLCLNEALCPARAEFNVGRQFHTSNSPALHILTFRSNLKKEQRTTEI